MKLKRVLASTLATLALSMGFAFSQAAPAEAICVGGKVTNGSGYSFLYKTRDNIWRTLYPRATTSSSIDVNYILIPVGHPAQIYVGANAPYKANGGATVTIRDCVTTTVVVY